MSRTDPTEKQWRQLELHLPPSPHHGHAYVEHRHVLRPGKSVLPKRQSTTMLKMMQAKPLQHRLGINDVAQKPDTVFVYIARTKCGTLFKIGKSRDVTARLRYVGADNIDLASSFMLRVANDDQAHRLERYLHLAFAEWRVDKAAAGTVVGDEYGGLTEWFRVECLPRLDAILDHCADLFPHERLAGALLFGNEEEHVRRKSRPGRRARRLYSDEELWVEAKPQIEAIAARVSTVIGHAVEARVRNFGFGAGRLYGFCRRGDATSMALLINDAFDQGGVKLPSQWIGLVTGCILPSAVSDFTFCLHLNLPGPWDSQPFSTRVRTYFAGLLADMCTVETLDARVGWSEFLASHEEA